MIVDVKCASQSHLSRALILVSMQAMQIQFIKLQNALE